MQFWIILALWLAVAGGGSTPEEPVEIPVEISVVEGTPVVEETLVVEEASTPEPTPKPQESQPVVWETLTDDHLPLEPTTRAQLQNQRADHYTTLHDFEAAMMGTCPKDVPAGLWPDPLFASVALGLPSTITRAELNTPKGQVRSVWNQYMRGDLPATYDLGYVDQLGVDFGTCAFRFGNIITNRSGILLTANLVTGAVWVRYDKDGHAGTTPAQDAQIESMRAEAESHLKYLITAYKAKCGS